MKRLAATMRSSSARFWQDARSAPSISGRWPLLPRHGRVKARGAQPLPKTAIPKGAWWEVFHDEQLNQYEKQLLAANQSLAAAQDRLARGAFAGAGRIRWIIPDHEHRP